MVVFLWWCSCGGVQSTTPVLQSTTPYYKVLLCTTKYYSSTTPTTKYYSSTTPYYKVLLRTTKYYSSTTKYYSQSTTKYDSITTKYYSVLQSTTPVLLCTTKYYSSTTPYDRALLRPLKRRQNGVLPVLLRTTPASTTKASKTSISCDASATFQGTSLQNEHFVRGFLQISQNELPKRAFRAMLPFHRKSFQKDRFVRGFVTSSKFHRRSFQNERFARCFLQNSQNKLSKRAFRAMLPTIFTEKASKSFRARFPPNFIEQCFQNERFARCFRQFSPNIAFRYSFARSTHRFLRDGSSAKSKMCLALQRRAFPNFNMYISLQRREQKCMNLSTVNRPASRTQKCEVLLQFWAIDTTFLPRGLTRRK